MALLVISSGMICFIKAAFQGIGTQQGFFVNNLPFLAKLSNHLATMFRKCVQATKCIESSKQHVYLQGTPVHQRPGASASKRKWAFYYKLRTKRTL